MIRRNTCARTLAHLCRRTLSATPQACHVDGVKQKTELARAFSGCLQFSLTGQYPLAPNFCNIGTARARLGRLQQSQLAWPEKRPGPRGCVWLRRLRERRECLRKAGLHQMGIDIDASPEEAVDKASSTGS